MMSIIKPITPPTAETMMVVRELSISLTVEGGRDTVNGVSDKKRE